MRTAGSIEKVSVLVVIGVTESGQKQVIALQSGDKESAASWRELFKDLKGRGLDNQAVTLGVMDGLTGLEKVFREEFPKGKVQRCQVHVMKNVLAKVPRKLKQPVADDIRSVFYASSRRKALELFSQFKKRWQKDVPSAVKCLENSLEACLTFFDFPEEEWISLRTANVIERLNKEFKRRTRPMEILAGKNACHTLLAFISIKMELHWRSAQACGKVVPCKNWNDIVIPDSLSNMDYKVKLQCRKSDKEGYPVYDASLTPVEAEGVNKDTLKGGVK